MYLYSFYNLQYTFFQYTMNIILPLLSGFLAAIVGVLPPGLINMSAAKISLTDGKKRAMLFVLGALIVIFFQTYISVLFARYINSHHEVIAVLRQIGFVIFTVISVYFLFFAKKPNFNQGENLQLKSKKSRFFLGMLISALNVFPIPYYVLISITLASYRVFSFESSAIYSLVLGVVLGSLLVFYFYVVFFNNIKSKNNFFAQNMNAIIGVITGLVALLTLYNILK